MKMYEFTQISEPNGFVDGMLSSNDRKYRGVLFKAFGVVLMSIMLSLFAREAGAEITDIDPSIAVHGAEIVIEGNGFGSKKPKVTLIESNPAGKRAKKVALRVIDNDDTTITASLKNGMAGDYTLEVKPARGAVMTAAQGFTIAAPENITLSDEQGEIGDEIEVYGDFFGDRRPQVFIGGKKVKVVDFGEDFAAVLVPKIANGLHEVSVRNRAGDGVSSVFFEVVNSSVKPKKQHQLKVKFDGKNYAVGGKTLTAVYSPVTKQITIMALKASGMSVRNLTLTGQVDLDTLPAAIGPGFGPGDIIYQLPGVAGNSQYQSANNSDEWRVLFNHYENGYLYGSFSGMLRNSQNNNDTVRMSSGTFAVKVIQ
ncbi:IPT/TIG domain-containing protein [Methylotuvimicrobium sp. KM2]|uniref:IPT/TIG domain-containing protein n=1 Tax=Methylotuvimicrobium sp. KM2 TaxID=3133976 RepID=UPI0031010489